jgi:bis(5'-nucleosyl)-tetraphosphatase (symmetrical)
MRYLIGDVQGCCDSLSRLLDVVAFSPSRDHLVALGDLVNRGPDSLGTLRLLRGLGNSASCLLGNHDLHLLAVAHGVRPAHRNDTLAPILEAPDRNEWIDWLRHRRMALDEDGWLMVHAGVAPQWDRALTMTLAAEVEARLQSNELRDFLVVMYGNQPTRWESDLQGADRLRFAINALTRIRFVDTEGALDLKTKESADKAPKGLVPWFDAPGRLTQGVPIAFGHWSTLGLQHRPDLLALDTGCVWGGLLTAARLRDGQEPEFIQVQCPQAQKPG